MGAMHNNIVTLLLN